MEKKKAAIRRKQGLPRTMQVEDIEKPIPNDNEVLIQVFATFF